MGFFDELFGLGEQKEKDEKARSLRDAEMERRAKAQAAEDKERQAKLTKEIEQIRAQAARRKNRWF